MQVTDYLLNVSSKLSLIPHDNMLYNIIKVFIFIKDVISIIGKIVVEVLWKNQLLANNTNSYIGQ